MGTSDTLTLFSPAALAAMAERERAATPDPRDVWHTEECVTAPTDDCVCSGGPRFSERGTRRVEYARLLAVAQWANELVHGLEELFDDLDLRLAEIRTRMHGRDDRVVPVSGRLANNIRALLARLTPPQEKPKGPKGHRADCCCDCHTYTGLHSAKCQSC